MTNEQIFDDLKQFISATVSQSEARLSGRMDSLENRMGGLENRIDGIESRMATKEDLMAVEQRLGRKIDDVQKAVGEAMLLVNDDVDERFDDHEHRLQRLKHRHA